MRPIAENMMTASDFTRGGILLCSYFSIVLSSWLSRSESGCTFFFLINLLAVLALASIFIADLVVNLGLFFRSLVFQRRFIEVMPVLLLCYLTVMGTMIVLAPLSSWDFLSYWSLATIDALGASFDSGISDFQYEVDKHPWMIPEFLASQIKLGNSLLFQSFYWFEILLLHIGSIQFIGRALGNTNTVIGIAILAMFFPLFENHSTNAGYAETTLSIGILLLLGTVVIGIRKQAKSFFVIAATICLTLPLVKTSGWIFCGLSVGALSAGCACCTANRYRKVIVVMVFTGCALILGATELSGLHISVLKTGTLITSPDLSVLTGVLSQAVLYNLSFSVTPLLIVLLILAVQDVPSHYSGVLVMRALVFFWIGFIFFTLLFLLTDYGLGHALPTNDTSFSRLSVAVAGSVALGILLILPCVSLFSGQVACQRTSG